MHRRHDFDNSGTLEKEESEVLFNHYVELYLPYFKAAGVKQFKRDLAFGLPVSEHACSAPPQ